MIELAHDACRGVLAHEILGNLNWHGPVTQLTESFPAYPRHICCLSLKTVN